jgi:hypothetical protein
VDESDNQLHESENGLFELVVASCEPPESLRFAEQSLDLVPLVVGLPHHIVPRPGNHSMAMVGNHRQRVNVVQATNAILIEVETLFD